MSATTSPASPLSPDAASATRPWHACWPVHMPRSIDYPRAPAWWLLERNVAQWGSRVAVRDLDHASMAERRSLTYDGLFRAVRGIASGLGSLGVSGGARVGFCLPNSAELIAGYYAAWYAGGDVVPANPSAGEGEVEHQLADAGVSLVVAPDGSPGARAAERLGVPRLSLPAFREMEALPPGRPADCAPDDDAAVL